MKKKLIYEYGINDFDTNVIVNKKAIREYAIWVKVLQRCYSNEYKSKHPTYKDCYAEEYLHSFKNFYTFIRTVKGFDIDGFQIDKDILSDGNKCYSRDTIVFLPHEINSFLTKADAIRGDLPLGVSKSLKKFMARLRIDGVSVNLGTYNTPLEAFNAYKDAKEQQAKVLAERWKDHIDERAYGALMSYKV